jgi:peptidoglycan hydrolase CwlO-like protein
MEKLILEDQIKQILGQVIAEETSKVSRYEFGRVQFKIDELENSLNETIKEFRKLQDSIPSGLKGVTNSRLSQLSSNLTTSKKVVTELKEKVKKYKRSVYTQQTEETKK